MASPNTSFDTITLDSSIEILDEIHNDDLDSSLSQNSSAPAVNDDGENGGLEIDESRQMDEGVLRQLMDEEENAEEDPMPEEVASDEEHLYDPSLGSRDHSNIKKPLRGFDVAYEQQIYPLIEAKSMILYDIVQKHEAKLLASSVAILRAHGPVYIPWQSLGLDKAFGRIKLRILDEKKSEEELPEQSSSSLLGTSVFNEDEKVLTLDKVAKLAEPFPLGMLLFYLFIYLFDSFIVSFYNKDSYTMRT